MMERGMTQGFKAPKALAQELRLLFGPEHIIEEATPPRVYNSRMSQTLTISNAEGRHAMSFAHNGRFEDLKITGVLTTEYFK
jgi:hypothetical protein